MIKLIIHIQEKGFDMVSDPFSAYAEYLQHEQEFTDDYSQSHNMDRLVNDPHILPIETISIGRDSQSELKKKESKTSWEQKQKRKQASYPILPV